MSAALSADPVQGGLQILGIGATEVDPLARAGVLKPEADRVQPLAFEAERCGQHRVSTVGEVSGAGMAQGREVNPDLMSAPRFQVDLHEGD